MKNLLLLHMIGLIFCGVLSSCGQTGPLYLPEKPITKNTQTTTTGKA